MSETIPPDTGLPSRAEFAAALGVQDQNAVGLLRVLIARCAPPAPIASIDDGGTGYGVMSERLLALEQVCRFVLGGPAVGLHPFVLSLPSAISATKARDQIFRLELLTRALENIPAATQRMRACIAYVMKNTTAITLFAEVGLPNDRGLIAETTDRMARRWLPQPPDERNLAALCFRIIGKQTNIDLEAIEPYATLILFRLAKALGFTEQQSVDARDAMYLLSARVAALGLAEGIRARTPNTGGSITASPFLQLARTSVTELPGVMSQCRVQLEKIRNALEDSGVSVDLVYSIDTMERGLDRMEALWPFAAQSDMSAIEPRHVFRLFGQLAGGLAGERSFRSLLADNFRLLARKIIENAGHTGEHYVTSNRSEYWKMLGSAAGGGLLTAGTAITKYLIKWAHMPLFIDGAASSLLYAVSFLAIQLCGFTLATKQPSMTAAALAGTLRASSGEARTSGLVELIARISRSQFAAALGNVSVAVVVSIIFDVCHRYYTGNSYLSGPGAMATIASFHPLSSGTLFFAAFTGVLLWCSSLFAGWFENIIVFRRIPEALAHHPLGNSLGRHRMQWLAGFVDRQAAGFGGSISLGVLLGMTPVFATFFGLPLDVRHVTLSSGSLTLAASALGPDVLRWADFGMACLGIGAIGLLNFGVSFVLALLVALRARDVPRGEWSTLPGAVVRYFLRYPTRFFYPPAKGRETTRHLTDVNLP